MAFYFALLNVSAKKEEKQHKNKRRRHSIASVESPLLDYRLLPKLVSQEPQLMGEDGEKKKLGLRKSESNYSTGRRGDSERQERLRRTPDRKNKSKSRDHSFRDDPPDSACSSSAISDVFESHKERKKRENSQEKPKTKKQTLNPNRKKLFPTLHPPPNSPAIVGNISPEFLEPGPSKPTLEVEPKRGQKFETKKIQAMVRPMFHRRRRSPDSTTSGSRRSSKGSQNSLPRRDTPCEEFKILNSSLASSSCSRRESEEPPGNALNSLLQAGQRLAGVHITRPQDKFNQNLKKVTFNGSPLVIRNNFLGERAVLVQTGGTVLRRSSTVAQPLAACGVDWWGLCAENGPGEGENTANTAIEEGSKLNRMRPSLLRRRSTSDRGRVAFVLQNDGFLTEQEEKDKRNGNVEKSHLKRSGTTKG